MWSTIPQHFVALLPALTLPPDPGILHRSGHLLPERLYSWVAKNRAKVVIVDSSFFFSPIVDNATLMVALADYHVDAALRYAEHGTSQRFSLLDLSQRLSRGARAFDWDSSGYAPDKVLTHYSLRDRNFLEGARSLVVFNDTNPVVAELLNRARKSGIPTVGVVEGAVDFGRALNDLESQNDSLKAKGYHNVDHVFLHGYWSQKFFAEKPTRVVGSSRAEFFLRQDERNPSDPSILLNINFSYGVLTDAAPAFVEGFIDATSGSGVEIKVTQHPRDSTDVPARLNGSRSRDSVAALQSASVLVSRFSTVIIDALALGVPVVYFNPHGEPVEELLPPFGAFEIARNSQELSDAIKRSLEDRSKGKDVRLESAEFLFQHAGLRRGYPTTSQRFGEALQAVVKEGPSITLRNSGESVTLSDAVRSRKVTVADERNFPQNCKSWLFFLWNQVRVAIARRITR